MGAVPALIASFWAANAATDEDSDHRIRTWSPQVVPVHSPRSEVEKLFDDIDLDEDDDEDEDEDDDDDDLEDDLDELLGDEEDKTSPEPPVLSDEMRATLDRVEQEALERIRARRAGGEGGPR